MHAPFDELHKAKYTYIFRLEIQCVYFQDSIGPAGEQIKN